MRWENDASTPVVPPISFLGWCRVCVRAVALIITIFGGLALMLLFRLMERPVFGASRPITPWITVFVCRAALLLIGLRVDHCSKVMPVAGVLVSNHTSWLDIFVLNAAAPLYFVSKSEVAGWPGIGWLARATGTIFIDRNPRHARLQRDVLTKRLLLRHRLLFFPEGTSTDGQRVLPFKSTLFSAICATELPETMWVQPVSVVFNAPFGLDTRHYGWWGDMSFGAHLLKILATRQHGRVSVLYHTPLSTKQFPERKEMAMQCAHLVERGHQNMRSNHKTRR